MTSINPYFRSSKLSEAKFRQIIKCYSLDLTATASAAMTHVSIRSVNALFIRLRIRLMEVCRSFHSHGLHQAANPLKGETPSPRGEGRIGKTIVFGIHQRDGCICTEVFSDGAQALLQVLLRGEPLRSLQPSLPAWEHLEGVVDMQFDRFLPVKESAISRGDTAGLSLSESFWQFAKSRLRKFQGLSHHTFHLHLKECEFRFNHRSEDLYPILLKLLRHSPL